MMLAFDSDALYQLVVLVLLGAGGMVKSFLERKRKGEADLGAGQSATRQRREDTHQRLSELEGGTPGAPEADPWQLDTEEDDPQVVVSPVEVKREYLVKDFHSEEPVVAASAPTPEASIEGPALDSFIPEAASFDERPLSEVAWDPGERIRESVFEDIEQSVFKDISEHVSADMAGGVRGEAQSVKIGIHRKAKARRGWRDAVVAAEVLGVPMSLRDPASLPAGLQNG